MRFKTLCSLTATMIIGLGMTSGPRTDSFSQKKPANTGPKQLYSHIHTYIDTLNITDSTLKSKTILANGIFFPYTGKIQINYMKTNSTTPKIQRFCQANNNQIRLTIRHEKEHARKANLTKNTWFFEPSVRGAIAAHNEIMAPAAEIIEALDYRYETGEAYPTSKIFIRDADKIIVTEAQKHNLAWPLDFNNPHIARLVMRCATERFAKEVKRGVYRKAISDAVLKYNDKQYITNDLCDSYRALVFKPQWNMWGPMWEFTSLRGPVNLWNAVDSEQKSKLTNTVDSIVTSIAGKKSMFFKYTKTR